MMSHKGQLLVSSTRQFQLCIHCPMNGGHAIQHYTLYMQIVHMKMLTDKLSSLDEGNKVEIINEVRCLY